MAQLFVARDRPQRLGCSGLCSGLCVDGLLVLAITVLCFPGGLPPSPVHMAPWRSLERSHEKSQGFT